MHLGLLGTNIGAEIINRPELIDREIVVVFWDTKRLPLRDGMNRFFG